MEIKVRKLEALPLTQALPLYESVGWTNYTSQPEMLEQALAHSLCVLGAYAEDRLIGLVRAVGDGASILYVQDLLVYPEWQRQGVGTQLMQALLHRYSAVYQVVLLTDDTEKTNGFYRSLGLTPAELCGCHAFIHA